MKIKTGRKLYSLKETYTITYQAFRSFRDLAHARREKLLTQQFTERIMLAVTEVNGCEVCSYAHTKMALESGMNEDEIQNMLAGLNDNVPSDELPAILFAQHYADYRGQASREAWEQIVKLYGLSKAKGILASIRMIMVGNVYGIVWSSFINRFKGKPDKRSNLAYELSLILSTFVFIPTAFIHSLLPAESTLLRLN